MSRLSGTLGILGTAGTCASTAAALGCCSPAVLGPASALLATGVAWLPASVQYDAFYASLALMLAGFVVSARRHHRPSPLILGVAGAVALLLALHEAWDLGAFQALICGGSGVLVMGAIVDARAKRDASRPDRREVGARCAT